MFLIGKGKNNGGILGKLKPAGAGFIKLILVVLLVLIISAGLSIFNYYKIDARADNSFKPIGYRHYFINPKDEEINVLYLDETGEIIGSRGLTSDQYPKSNLEIFYGNELIGYFQKIAKNGETSPAGEEDYYKNYIKLMIKRGENGEPREVYRGDVHTSYWEWRDNKHVVVYYGCGTHCLYYYVIDIDDKNIEDEGHVYE